MDQKTVWLINCFDNVVARGKLLIWRFNSNDYELPTLEQSLTKHTRWVRSTGECSSPQTTWILHNLYATLKKEICVLLLKKSCAPLTTLSCSFTVHNYKVILEWYVVYKWSVSAQQILPVRPNLSWQQFRQPYAERNRQEKNIFHNHRKIFFSCIRVQRKYAYLSWCNRLRLRLLGVRPWGRRCVSASNGYPSNGWIDSRNRRYRLPGTQRLNWLWGHELRCPNTFYWDDDNRLETNRMIRVSSEISVHGIYLEISN